MFVVVSASSSGRMNRGVRDERRLESMKRYGVVSTLAAVSAATVISLFDSGARADNPLLGNNDGIDTHLFRPTLDSKGFFATNGSDILGHLDFSFGLVVDYGRTIGRLDNQLTQ